MKKHQIIGLIAISGLLIFSCGQKKAEEVKSVVPEKLEEKKIGSLKIAFYDQDSLKKQYTFYTEQDKLIEKKQINFQAQVEKMTKEYQDFIQRNEARVQRQELSQVQIQGVQQEAASREQKIMKYQQDMGAQLEKETFDRLDEIGKKIETYSSEFSKMNKIDILLTHAKGGQISYITPTMDVTNEFIEFLNQKEQDIKKDMGGK